MKYRDSSIDIESRIEDLLSRMTVEEKIGQMCQVDGRDNPEEWISERGVGSLLHISSPEIARLQGLARASGHGIPLLIAIDAIHGHAFHDNTTVFPTQLAMGAAWNPELMEHIGRVTAEEMRATGIHWTFSPVFDLARDARWGRCDETFGEDPYLSGELGSALIRGYQGSDPAGGSNDKSVIACAKHFVAHGEVEGGRDSDEVSVSKRVLRSTFFPPFAKAVESGVHTVMAAYHAIDGVPCSANSWLLKQVLRDEMGFQGIVVTDWNNVGRMIHEQCTMETIEEAAIKAIEAGNDMIMATPEFYRGAVDSVRKGRVDEKLIDRAVKRILRLKFQWGLFDKPNVEVNKESYIGQIISTEDSRELAYKAALQSIVMLKNDGFLPLSPGIKKIAVVGSLADDIVAHLGDWSFGPRGNGGPDNPEYHQDTVTILRGLQNRFGQENILVFPGESVSYALEAALQADAVVAVVGDRLEYIGELHDRADLEIPTQQVEMLRALYSTGIPLISAVVAGKPLVVEKALLYSEAVMYVGNPGLRGGEAFSSLLKGDESPSGKTAISFPRHTGQLPVYYNHPPGRHINRYCDLPEGPLIPFGFGLSYTVFEYGELQTDKTEYSQNETIEIKCIVSNIGKMDADEIVQLYVRDEVSAVTTPVLELKGFTRQHIPAGHTEDVHFSLPIDKLSLIDSRERRLVEPGFFTLYIGGSSRRKDLKSTRVKVIPFDQRNLLIEKDS